MHRQCLGANSNKKKNKKNDSIASVILFRDVHKLQKEIIECSDTSLGEACCGSKTDNMNNTSFKYYYNAYHDYNSLSRVLYLPF